MRTIKKTYLYVSAYLMELEEDEIRDGRNEYDDLEREIDQNISNDIILESGHEMVWQSTSSKFLDPERTNCGQCEKCGSWTTDREREKPIHELCNGARVKGKLLCDECLPQGHRWAF